jgi:glutamate-ammonia-ligase adenylyltransferase
MTVLAEVSIAAALETLQPALEAELGTPFADGARQQLLVVGMGKLGGGELNVSSDVDLAFVYPEEGETRGPRSVSNHEFFARLGRKLIKALDEATDEGRVFRVDMRLRPWGDAGPLATSFDALENYLVTQGREWERYAWIKARALSGDRSDALSEIVRPFVFRKYLDYGAFAAVRELHAQIRAEVARREMSDHISWGAAESARSSSSRRPSS